MFNHSLAVYIPLQWCISGLIFLGPDSFEPDIQTGSSNDRLLIFLNYAIHASPNHPQFGFGFLIGCCDTFEQLLHLDVYQIFVPPGSFQPLVNLALATFNHFSLRLYFHLLSFLFQNFDGLILYWNNSVGCWWAHLIWLSHLEILRPPARWEVSLACDWNLWVLIFS